jgi:response regulator NasT
MENILVVSGAEKGRIYLEDFLTSCRFGKVTAVCDAAAAGEEFKNNEYDLCIINTPLPDRSGVELALDTVKQGFCQCMLVTAAEVFEKFGKEMEQAGVFVIVKPLKRESLWIMLKSIAVVHNRLTPMKEENENLKHKLEGLQLVSRAKALLISNLKMTEPQAHRFLEKQAMERRMTKSDIARRVIRTYEDNTFKGSEL